MSAACRDSAHPSQDVHPPLHQGSSHTQPHCCPCVFYAWSCHVHALWLTIPSALSAQLDLTPKGYHTSQKCSPAPTQETESYSAPGPHPYHPGGRLVRVSGDVNEQPFAVSSLLISAHKTTKTRLREKRIFALFIFQSKLSSNHVSPSRNLRKAIPWNSR